NKTDGHQQREECEEPHRTRHGDLSAGVGSRRAEFNRASPAYTKAVKLSNGTSSHRSATESTSADWLSWRQGGHFVEIRIVRIAPVNGSSKNRHYRAMPNTPRFHKTKNDLPLKTRERAVALLNARLLDALDLQLQSKQAHWTVKGPEFIALHELFDKVADAAEDAVDLIAERAVQLGGVPVGTARAIASGSTLPPYPVNAVSGKQHVEALSTALAACGARVRKAIDEAGTIGDMDTADLFTEVSREIDKYLWFVEAHGQA